MITINDVAKLAGVSKSTVSRAFNPDTSIKESTKLKIMAAADKLGYVPNISARGLAINKKFVIGLFMTRIHADASPYFSTIISAVNGMLPPEYLLSIVNISQFNSDTNFLKNRFDGVIIFSHSKDDDPIIHKLISEDIPTTVVLRDTGNKYVDNIYANEQLAINHLTNYICKMGHQRIGFINGSSNFTSSKIRYASVKDTVTSNGSQLLDVADKQGEFSILSGERLMTEIIKLPAIDRPTCVLCASDDIALGALKACHELNIKVPSEISLTGYDNILYSQISTPSLTTISNPLKAMTETGIQLLLNRINHNSSTVKNVIFNPTLLIRNSVKKLNIKLN